MLAIFLIDIHNGHVIKHCYPSIARLSKALLGLFTSTSKPSQALVTSQFHIDMETTQHDTNTVLDLLALHSGLANELQCVPPTKRTVEQNKYIDIYMRALDMWRCARADGDKVREHWALEHMKSLQDHNYRRMF